MKRALELRAKAFLFEFLEGTKQIDDIKQKFFSFYRKSKFIHSFNTV